MNPFDTNMMALLGLILFIGVGVIAFLKEAILPWIGLVLVFVLLWGDDICSRKERLAFYTNHFNARGEVICKENNAQPILISQTQGWEVNGGYFFKGIRGVDILEDRCEIIGKTEPHCISVATQIIIGSAAMLAMLGWMLWGFRRTVSDKRNTQDNQTYEGRKVKTPQEPHAEPIPFEQPNQTTEAKASKNGGHVMEDRSKREFKDREIQEGEHEDDDDTQR